MFCGNCGAQMPDGTVYCPECGAKQNVATANVSNGSPVNDMVNKVKSMDKNRLIGIGAVAVVVIILLFVIFGGRGPEATLKKYYKLQLKGEYIAANKLYPSKYLDYLIEEYYDDDKSEYKEEMKDREEDTKDDLKDEDFKLEYVKVEEDDNYTDSQIEDIEDYYEDEYDIKLKIKDAKDMKVKVKYKYDGETVKNEDTMTVIKIGGKWYVAPYFYTED